MTFAQILADVYRRLSLPVAPSSADTIRIKAFCNEAHRELLTAPGLDRLRDDAITFASVAGQALYTPGPAVARIKDLYDATTNQWRLKQLDLNDLRRIDPGLVATGNPDWYVPIGYKQVLVQPSAATGVWAVSTSASDTGITLYIEGVRTGGNPSTLQSVTLTGTSRVQVGTLTDLIEIDKCFLSAAAVGTVSLYTASAAGTELARIPIGFTEARNWVLQLYPTPSSVVTYTMDYTRDMLDLMQDTDEPFLPQDFHDLLCMGARMKEYEFRSDSRFVPVAAQYIKRRSDLFQWVQNPPDYRPVPGKRVFKGGSNLGGNFPVGRW